MTFPLHAIAAALGLLLARRERRFRSMSRAVLLLLAVNAAMIVARAARGDVSARLAAIAAGLPVAPYVGLARASWAVEQTMALAWYAVLAWAVWRALKDEGPRHGFEPSSLGPQQLNHPDSNRSPTRGGGLGVTLSRTTASHCRDVGRARSIYLVLALLASSVLLFALYPIARGRTIDLASTVVFAAALVVQLAAATGYVLRWRQPDAARGVALVLVAGSVADAAGPWLLASPARDWTTGEPIGVLIWCVVGGVELWAIAKTREP